MVSTMWAGPRLRISLQTEHLRQVLPVHEDISDKTLVDISSTRNDADRSVAKQLFQSQLGGLSVRLVQFRRVDAPESDALTSISKGVTINYVDLPTVDRALDATEWCRDLSTEQRSETSATGSAEPFRFLVRMESFLAVQSVGMDHAAGLWFRLPAEITGGT